MAVLQDGVAARKQQAQQTQQKQQVFRTDIKFDGHTKFVTCRKFKFDRKNSDFDRTKNCITFQRDCIEIDLDTKFKLNRMRRHLDCTKFDADEKSDADEFDVDKFDADESDSMNAKACRNSELFETYKNFEFHCLNSEKHRKFDFHSTNFKLDCMRFDSEMKFELDCMHFETCRKVDFNCHNRKHHYFIFAFDLCMGLNRSHSIKNINQT